MISTKGIALLHKVKEKILKNPRQLEMSTWDCGTAACIAGWMARIEGVYIPSSCFYLHEWRAYVRSSLGVTGSVSKLVSVSDWDQDLKEDYLLTTDINTRAKTACRAIDRFIAANK